MNHHPDLLPAGLAAAVILGLSALLLPCRTLAQGGWEETAPLPDPVGTVADMTVDRQGNLFILTRTSGTPLQSRLFRSTDHGGKWEIVPTEETAGAVTAIASGKSDMLWVVGEKGLFRSGDGGENWSPISLPPEAATGMAHLSLTPSGGISLIREQNSLLSFFVSTDSGATWLSTESDQGVFYSPQSFHLHKDGNVYISAAEGFLRYRYDDDNKGFRYDKSFSQGLVPIYHYVPVITGSYQTGMLFIASYNGTGTPMERISRSINNGATWRTLRELTPGDQWETKGLVITQAEEILLITRTQGIFFSATLGEDWQKIGGSLPGELAIGLYADESDGGLYAAEENGTRIFRSTRGASGIERSPGSEALHSVRSFPNPSDHAVIEYTLPGTREARVTIYDALGRPVRSLTDTPRVLGSGTILWDGTDDKGLPLPNGTYIITLYGEGNTTARTMMTLLR